MKDLKKIITGWGWLSLAIVAWLYLSSNISYFDKSVFLQNRSPAAASCMRNFQTAPTYCGRQMFIIDWIVGPYELFKLLAPPLFKHSLSVFSSRQVWSLQGDFILPSVQVEEKKGVPEVFWMEGLEARPISFSSFKNLNLFLHTPNAMEWSLDLPSNLKQAEFRSAVAISRSAPEDVLADGLFAVVSLEVVGKAPVILFRKYLPPNQHEWQPIKISLARYRGEKIKLRLMTDMKENIAQDWAVFRSPSIEVELDLSNQDAAHLAYEIKPSNVAGSPLYPRYGIGDLSLNIFDPKDWAEQDMQKESGGTRRFLGKKPRFINRKDLNICLADYSHIIFKLAVANELVAERDPDSLRQAQLNLELDDDSAKRQEVRIQLLPDDLPHEYSYELKLLELPQGARLTGLEMAPVIRGLSHGKSWAEIFGVGLIKRNLAESFCR